MGKYVIQGLKGWLVGLTIYALLLTVPTILVPLVLTQRINDLADVNTQRSGQLEQLNQTLLLTVSRLEQVMMDTATNVTILESGTCKVYGRSTYGDINYDFGSVLTHDNSTIYFIKIHPFTQPAPVNLNFFDFGFESFSGSLWTNIGSDQTVSRRLMSPKQIEAIQLTQSNDAFFSVINFYYGQYVLFPLTPTSIPVLISPNFDIRLVQPLIIQVPIEPVYIDTLPVPLRKK